MSGRGRDRFRREYPSRSEERTHHGRKSLPPSRHLWVGNMPPGITEKVLANHFLQFGEIETIAFQPGRSYAFINFKYEEEAFAAVRALQGFEIHGNQLKIEFAKADKPSSSRGEDLFQHRDDQRSEVRRSPLMRSRVQHPSPDRPGKRKGGDKDAEPSEVLWIGFPAQLRVNEAILRKEFSPFGEIEKVTAFEGRAYAFVRYRDIRAACRAKEALHGRLFDNPRVHISFAKNESGLLNSGRNSSQAPASPRFDPYGRSEISEDFRRDRNYRGFLGDPTMRSPRYMPNIEPDYSDNMGFHRNEGLDRRRSQRSPEMDRRYQDFHSHRFPENGTADEDWDLPEDNLLFHGNKKVKTTSFPPENELPEFSLPGFDNRRPTFPGDSSDFHPHGKISEPGTYGYKPVPDRALNPTSQYGKRDEDWGTSYDQFEAGPDSFPSNRIEKKKVTPEPHLWNWEGTIAKGGTPVCRARCFPKGKVLDMPLPEFLDCTARTGLEMLAKHYYQAASTWVVFFVPESDADIGLYNEFMHYLEEKQRAAVAKLDDRTTLFLVPPSEFAEKVLKVPGKLSISGVILRLENSDTDMVPPQNPYLKEEPHFLPHHGDTSLYPKPRSPPGQYPSMSSYPNMVKSGVPDHMVHQRQNTLGYNPNLDHKNGAPQVSNSGYDPGNEGYNPPMPRVVEETRSSSTPLSALEPDQLAQLASSLLGPSRQPGSSASSFSAGGNFRQSNMTSHSGTSYQLPQRHVFENNHQASSGFSTSQFGQGNSQQQPTETAQGNQSAISNNGDQDPQKKLQATLQLAATLLQQIQQAKGT